ncbi:hypothetical protein RHGRI_035305 [Rhododendron griersonianum]|uniref:non-specific serine/threonine protein kinase n=1 Tax=Rhododendron griersonianum TaxID=479676 RepID=A0AAV6I9S9_9ERIC|nr:hypothetical protein RHGRI_035305 [Rhododendron griersonianum]
MLLAAIVEHYRKRKAIESGYHDTPSGVVHMSAMSLVPQHLLSGIAEARNMIASNEFFYSELPKSMLSIAMSLSRLGLAVGSLLASLILSTVADITKRGGKGSWISNNINRSHYESYYWLLAVLSSVNLLYFLLCSWAYGPCADQGFSMLKDEGKDLKEEELPTVGNVDSTWVLLFFSCELIQGLDPSEQDKRTIVVVGPSGRVGRNLRDYGKKHCHVSMKALRKWSRQTLKGLDYLHTHDPCIIYRDLNCNNIFINRNVGKVKIGVLGLTAIVDETHHAHSLLGRPEYMAPELYEEDY